MRERNFGLKALTLCIIGCALAVSAADYLPFGIGSSWTYTYRADSTLTFEYTESHCADSVMPFGAIVRTFCVDGSPTKYYYDMGDTAYYSIWFPYYWQLDEKTMYLDDYYDGQQLPPYGGENAPREARFVGDTTIAGNAYSQCYCIVDTSGGNSKRLSYFADSVGLVYSWVDNNGDGNPPHRYYERILVEYSVSFQATKSNLKTHREVGGRNGPRRVLGLGQAQQRHGVTGGGRVYDLRGRLLSPGVSQERSLAPGVQILFLPSNERSSGNLQ